MGKKLTASGSFTVATIEDGVSVEAQYSPDKSTIHSVWKDGDIYMRTRESDSSVWSDWHKMVGESGGETVYSFNISKEKTSGGATTAPSNCFFPTWRDTPMAPTSAYPYLWMQIQKKDGNGNPVGDASYARVTGELGIDYEIRCAIDSIKIPKDTTSTSVTTTFNFYYKESGKTPIVHNAYYGIYYRIGTDYTLISNGSSSSASLSAYSVDNTKTAVVVFIFSASYSGNDPMSQSYLSKLELPIYEDGKDGLAPNPNILLRTVFDRGIDKVKEKWAGDWNYVGIDAASDTVIDGRKSIRINASSASTFKGFQQDVYGKIKTSTWYTLSFNYFATQYFQTFIYDGANTYGIVDRTAGYYIDGVYNSGGLGIDGNHTWPPEWQGKRHSITFKTKSSFGTTTALIIFRSPQGTQVAICMPKLEIGKDATTYIPNEDDLVGNDGQSIRGKTGRFYYYAQEWSNSSSPLYIVTDAQAPYFSYNGDYYVFNPEQNYPNGISMHDMGAPSTASSNWTKMWNDFKYIITQAIFTDFAKLGSGVFNKDWLFSAYGNAVSALYSGSGSSSQYDYKDVLTYQTSLPVNMGDDYEYYITWNASSSNPTLYARIFYSTNNGSSWNAGQIFIATSKTSSTTDTLRFKAEYTGLARLYFYGYGTIREITANSSLTSDYQKFTPAFVNREEQVLLNNGINVTSTSYTNVVNTQLDVHSGVSYNLYVEAQTGSYTLYLRIYDINNSVTVGSALSINPSSTSGTITVTATYTSKVVVQAYIASGNRDINYVSITPTNNYVPKTAIDWMSGYAHFGGGKERFEPDGSGQLAGGNIKWDENGYGQLAGGRITWDANKLNVQGRITADMLFAKSTMVGDANYTIDLENNPYNMYYVVDAGHNITLPLAGSYGGVILRFASLIRKPQGGSTTVYGIKLIASDYIWVKDGWGAYASSYTTVYIQNWEIVSIAAVGGVWIVLSGMVGASPEPMPA